MVRPRWHDALIVSAIVALFVVGVWSLWLDDVRSILHMDPANPASGPASGPAPGGSEAPAKIVPAQT
jgi:hypothetical protein